MSNNIRKTNYTPLIILGVALALIIAAMIGVMMHYRPKSASGSRTESRKEYVPPAPIENFDPVGNGALAITANRAEFDAVLLTLRERNQLRKSDARMTFATVERGLSKVTWSVRKGGALIPVEVFVVNAAEIPSIVLKDRIPSKRFHLVTLRGHTGDMMPLWEYSQPFQDGHCYTILGGCTASNLIRDLYTPERPLMADIGTGESANNTYLLVRTIDLIGGGKVKTWEELSDTLTSESGRVWAQSTMPGKWGYDSFVASARP